jgi:hypothetical protein
MISELQKWKEEFKKSNVKPWDVLNPELRADPKVGAARMTICEQCPQLIKGIKQCKECGCFMKVKVYLKDATCPLGRWEKTELNNPLPWTGPIPSEVKMFNFNDENTPEYKSHIKFVDKKTNKPRPYNKIDSQDYPYAYKELKELGSFKSFFKENILSKQESEYLIELANLSEPWLLNTIPFWIDRNLPFFNMLPSKATNPDIMNYCKDIYYKIKDFISDSFGTEVWADQIGIVRWPVNSWQMVHVDAVQGLDRVAGSVVFLNDDYEGGEPFYPYYERTITPKQGMVYAHDAGHDHLHGVTEVKNNVRYTISSTWTSNKDKCPYLQYI